MPRKRYGHRRWVAKFQQHNGTTGDHGLPTYEVDTDWATVINAWPAELITTTGGETVRGRQVTAVTTHVLFGEYFGVDGATAEMRCVVGGSTFGIAAVYDADGLSQEMRVELKSEL